jgi:transcription elongation factor
MVGFLCDKVAPRHEMRTAFVHGSIKCWVYLEATMNDFLRHLVKSAPGIIRNQSGFIFERVDSADGLTLLKMQHVSPQEVGKWVQVRKGIYKGDMGYVTSTRSGGVELLLIPRLSQPEAPKGNPSHSSSAPALFDYETVKRLAKIEPVRIQENIYSFRGDRFEHGLIIKSYASNLISMTVSCMPFESFSLFLESCHPTLMASISSFPKPLEWHFSEGDTVSYTVDSRDHWDQSFDKSGVISTLRNDAAELSTEEGTICVPWLNIRRVIHQGDFVEVTGGMYLGCRGWVGELQQLNGSLGDH